MLCILSSPQGSKLTRLRGWVGQDSRALVLAKIEGVLEDLKIVTVNCPSSEQKTPNERMHCL